MSSLHLQELSYSSYEELKSLSKFDFKTVNFNSSSICNMILKMYDQGYKYLSAGDEERAYMLLLRFFEAYLLLKKSRVFKEDKKFCESIISSQKLEKVITTLENISESLKTRYALRHEQKQAKINSVTNNKPEPIHSSSNPDIKKFITPIELTNLVNTTEFTFLLIDIRPKHEYDFSHMNMTILLNEKRKKFEFVSYLNIPNEVIKNVSWELEESLKENECEKLFSQRDKFDYVILIDKDTMESNFQADSKISILKKAIFEFDINKRLRNEPLLLEGGWNQWITYYPACIRSNNLAHIGVNPNEAVKINEDLNRESKKSFNFDYPEFNLPKPSVSQITEPDKKVVQWKTETPAVVASKSNVIESIISMNEPNKSNIITIPIVNRSNKPLEKIANLDEKKTNFNSNEMPKHESVVVTPSHLTRGHIIKALPQSSLPINNQHIFETVYKPTNRLNTIQSPMMKDGTSKVLDPNTGMFKIYSVAPAQPQAVQAKFTNEPIFKKSESKEETPTLTFNTKAKSNMKRTLSIPNIASLSDDLDEEIKEARLTNAGNKTNQPNNVNMIENFIPAVVAKPKVDRKNKPLDGSMHLKIQELDPIYSADIKPGLCGIRNLGNTCFMNCILQCLNSTPTLAEYFLRGHFRTDINKTNELGFRGEIANEYAVLVSATWSGHCKIISPKHFRYLIGQFNQQFLSNEQQDSQEFLLFLLDGLHEDLNRIRKRPKIMEKEDENESLSDLEASRKSWNIHLSINNSIIVDLFQGQFKSTVTCSTCKKASVKFDAFMYLTLPLLPSKCNLYECLDLFLKPENMTGECKWKCPRCKQYREATKKIDIWRLPPLLIIHLKRFKYQGVWRDKITTYCDYPIEKYLELDNYVLHDADESNTSYNYQLYAITNHSGTMDGGHYTAFCRHTNLKNRWFKFDDSDVKEVADKSVLKSSSSYILFYSLIN